MTDSFKKREIFGLVQETPCGFSPVGYKWVFFRKRNNLGEVVRFKARLGLKASSNVFVLILMRLTLL